MSYTEQDSPTGNTNNYCVYHLHSDLSNGVTNIDSITKFGEYIERAKECGMKAMAFAEHGSIFEWWHKKCAIEAAGMKYIHAVEAYLTATLDEKIRDNYHCVLIAKNYDGFLELNRLVSKSFNRHDNHFYYVPRISFEELFSTSKNIMITSACIGGVLNKADDETKKLFLEFMISNKDRCWLEIGHHKDDKQKTYNKYLAELSNLHGIPLIAGTDTHVLNEVHEEGRKILQKSKNIYFDGEDNWDLKFHDYDELVECYREQDSLGEDIYLTAIQNTNVMADMVEEFQLDRNTKYPHIYDNPVETFRKKIETARKNHPYINERYSKETLDEVIDSEFAVYEKTQSIDFMLLQTYIREWERENGIFCGYGRGSVSGSEIAYILGITEMDSLKFGLNFFRFMNPSRVTNADIDTDYGGADRDRIKEFILKYHMNLEQIKSSEIITFNTIALKGAIRDVCRALEVPLSEVSEICNACVREGTRDVAPDDLREKYPGVFKFVDIVNGTIVSIGTHPSGCLVSDLPIDETVGLCSTSGSEYPVSMLNMKELDDLMYVKLDILGLDNIGVINETCKMLGVDRLNPDNVDLDDEDVWKSIRDDTTLIFQWESNSAQAYLKKFMSDKTIEIAKKANPNFSYIKWLSFGNGLIRPGCASFRDEIPKGIIHMTGFKELDDALANTFGRITMQEDIMKFCKVFCGYSDAESDTVRRGIAKKKGTADLIGEMHDRFIEYSNEKFGVDKDKLEEIFPPIKQGILDASNYAFSWNHSDAYSMIGYICGYLRYYHPYEFLTAALNIFSDNTDKTAEITKYAQRNNIIVSMPRWGISRDTYAFDKEKHVISKNLTSIKYMSASLAEELYKVAHSRTFDSFIDVLYALEETSINSRQIDILIKLDFFVDFGNQRELLRINEVFAETFKKGDAKKINKEKIAGTPLEQIVEKYAVGVTKSGAVSKSYTLLDVRSILVESEAAIKTLNLPDLDDITKVKNFVEVMGYVGYVSGKEEDRKKLYVLDVFPLKRKKDGKQFGFSVVTKSIGSGVEARFTLHNSTYNSPMCGEIKKGDVILLRSWHREGQYFHMDSYKRLEAETA